MVLLIGAGLMIRSFYRLEKCESGFSYEHLTSFTVSLHRKSTRPKNNEAHSFNRLLEKRSHVTRRAIGRRCFRTAARQQWLADIICCGGQTDASAQRDSFDGGLHRDTRLFPGDDIPLRHGRYFTDQDNRSFIAGRDLSKLNEGERMISGSNVIIVDEEFARRYWPNEDAVGKRIRFGTDPKAPVLEVVGVVGRVKMESLSDDSNRVQGYFSFSQIPFPGMTVVIKATGILINSLPQPASS